jgi:hypothetical protein
MTSLSLSHICIQIWLRMYTYLPRLFILFREMLTRNGYGKVRRPRPHTFIYRRLSTGGRWAHCCLKCSQEILHFKRKPKSNLIGESNRKMINLISFRMIMTEKLHCPSFLAPATHTLLKVLEVKQKNISIRSRRVYFTKIPQRDLAPPKLPCLSLVGLTDSLPLKIV